MSNISFKYDDETLYDRELCTNLTKEQVLLRDIELAKREMDLVYQKFDLVTEPELIDSCIYELKSLQLKYKFLINQAKEMNLIVKS